MSHDSPALHPLVTAPWLAWRVVDLLGLAMWIALVPGVRGRSVLILLVGCALTAWHLRRANLRPRAWI